MARFPKAVWLRVFTPAPDAPVYSVRLRQPHERHGWIGTSSVAVDAMSGQVVDVYDSLHAPLANQVLDTAFALHNENIGGLAGRLCAMLVGLSLPALYVTGVWSWLAKRRGAAR
jgi:uncharacterized iron-regulated membrane protein